LFGQRLERAQELRFGTRTALAGSREEASSHGKYIQGADYSASGSSEIKWAAGSREQLRPPSKNDQPSRG
jgi:hypothetical protein